MPRRHDRSTWSSLTRALTRVAELENGLLGVTIDHGQSFNQFLVGQLEDKSSLEVKLWLYEQLTDYGCDWIVVSLDLLSAGVRGDTGLWLGSRDFIFEKESPYAISFAWDELLLAAKESECEGVKIGLIIGKSRKLLPRIGSAIQSIEHEAKGMGLRIILEPTFESGFSRSDFEWMVNLADEQRVDFLKLPLPSAARIVGLFESRQFSWFARSNDLTISEYAAGVETARAFGCVGTLAGRAAWHDCLKMAAEGGLNDAAALKLRDDLDSLRRALEAVASD